MEDKKVTVIISVYNAEKYIERCVNSICQQTYQNIEMILINDGSKDKSGELCDLYAKKDARITVVHQLNQGVSAVRNVGIKKAHGEYIIFVDVDDFLERDMNNELVKCTVNNCLTVGGYYIDIEKGKYENSVPVLYEKKKVSKVDKKQVVTVYKKGLLCSVWNKLYLTKIIKDNNLHFFENMSLAEDALFNLNYLTASNNDFIILNKPLYHYIKRENESLDQKYRSDFFEIQKTLFENIIEYGMNVHITKADMNELKYYYFNALVVAMDNLYCNRKKMEKGKYNEKMNRMKNEKIFVDLIKKMKGKNKLISSIRYCLIKRGAFVVDWKVRTIIKRKLGVI